MEKEMTSLETDVRKQPESLTLALDFYRKNEYYSTLRSLAQHPYDKIVLTGMGSSYAASLNAAARLRSAGFYAVAEVASDLLHYRDGLLTPRTLLVLVSQSGRSGEILELCSHLPVGITTAAFTNEEGSPLAQAAQYTFLMHLEPEQIVSTRSYIASQMLMVLLAEAFLGTPEKKILDELAQSLVYLAEAVKDFTRTKEKMLAHIGTPPYISLLGRGWSYATAEAGALFIKEGAKSPSIAFESAQFRHGPIELVDRQFAAMVFVPKGRCENLQKGIIQEICLHGGKVIAVAEEGVSLPSHPGVLPIWQHYGREELAPLVNITAVQAYIDYTALERKIDSGTFRCGSKVTLVQ